MNGTGVRSVRRAFEILELFAQLRRPLSLKDLTQKLDCPSSSLADLLKTMSQIGCLSFDSDTKTYFPTTRLAALGDWVGPEILPNTDPHWALNELRDETGETILLATPNDLEIQYLFVLEGPHGARYLQRPNGRRPLVKSGVGWLFLSQFNDDIVDRVWRRSIAAGLIARKDLPFDKLRADVASCRRNGYVIARDSLNDDAAVVAIALPDLRHGRQLAIGIGGTTERIFPQAPRIAHLLRERADRLAGISG